MSTALKCFFFFLIFLSPKYFPNLFRVWRNKYTLFLCSIALRANLLTRGILLQRLGIPTYYSSLSTLFNFFPFTFPSLPIIPTPHTNSHYFSPFQHFILCTIILTFHTYNFFTLYFLTLLKKESCHFFIKKKKKEEKKTYLMNDLI